MKAFLLIACLSAFCVTNAFDNSYHYSIDLRDAKDHSLVVELIPPHLDGENVIFSFPKMVPGTYSVYDFGRFVADFKAFDKDGNPLTVSYVDVNSYEIFSSGKLAHISYKVSDTYHLTKRDNPVFEPGGMDVEPDTCFVLNLHDVLGYFRNHTRQPYEITIIHNPALYGSTSLADSVISSTVDLYHSVSYNEAVDNPILYSVPDTTHLRVGNADVLISVFSPEHKANSKGLALLLDTLLQDQAKYLGGKLPVKKYSFLIYLAKHRGFSGGYGALEHSYSSMYYLLEGDNEILAPTLRDVAAHEFFHIVTPLNVHSKQIADFDFDQPKMSEHLWLYEGTTEYHAHMVQLRYGLISKDDFLNVLRQKIMESFFFNDSLAFTTMSRGCLDKYKDQYANVYAKGMLIGLCLDLELLHLSKGKYGLLNLINDLSATYGKDSAFNDSDLFPKIEHLTYPEIGFFLKTYVAGDKPLPLQEILAYAGVRFDPILTEKKITLGQCNISYNTNTNRMVINGISGVNAFGKKMKYKLRDEIYSINGQAVTLGNFKKIRDNWVEHTKQGDLLTIVVYRRKSGSEYKTINLKARAFPADVTTENSFIFLSNPTKDQMIVRDTWIKGSH